MFGHRQAIGDGQVYPTYIADLYRLMCFCGYLQVESILSKLYPRFSEMLWLLNYILRNELTAIQNLFPCGNLTIIALEQPTATGNKQ